MDDISKIKFLDVGKIDIAKHAEESNYAGLQGYGGITPEMIGLDAIHDAIAKELESIDFVATTRMTRTRPLLSQKEDINNTFCRPAEFVFLPNQSLQHVPIEYARKQVNKSSLNEEVSSGVTTYTPTPNALASPATDDVFYGHFVLNFRIPEQPENIRIQMEELKSMLETIKRKGDPSTNKTSAILADGARRINDRNPNYGGIV